MVFWYSTRVSLRSGATPGTVASSEGRPCGFTGFIVVGTVPEPPGFEPPGLEPPGFEPPGFEPPGFEPGPLVPGVFPGPGDEPPSPIAPEQPRPKRATAKSPRTETGRNM